MNYKIEIRKYSRTTSVPEVMGVVQSPTIPKIGEEIWYQGYVCTVSRVAYNFDDVGSFAHVTLLVASR